MKNNLNSNTILGIHNCCEKCPFIGRCAVGLQELELLQQEAIGTQPEFCKTIAAQFQTAIDLIHEVAKERGIDLVANPKKEWEQVKKESQQQLSIEVEKYDLGLEKVARNNIGQLKNAEDIIKWYNFFRPAKGHRIVMEHLEEE